MRSTEIDRSAILDLRAVKKISGETMDARIQELATLIEERNAVASRITAVIGHPALIGHVGEYIASRWALLLERGRWSSFSEGDECRSTSIRTSMRPGQCRRIGYPAEAAPLSTRYVTEQCFVSCGVCKAADGERSSGREISVKFITLNTNRVGLPVPNSFRGRQRHETKLSTPHCPFGYK